MDEDELRAERNRRLMIAGAKVLAVALFVGLGTGLGALVLVRSLGLNGSDTAGTDPIVVEPVSPLPSSALPVPSSEPPSPSASESYPDQLITSNPTAPSPGQLYLAASPVYVQSMDRIYLTGQWPGHDAVGLLVQRKESGSWADFGVQVDVRVGTFSTYVMSGHLGNNVFRVYDPSSGAASNPVTVNVS